MGLFDSEHTKHFDPLDLGDPLAEWQPVRMLAEQLELHESTLEKRCRKNMWVDGRRYEKRALEHGERALLTRQKFVARAVEADAWTAWRRIDAWCEIMRISDTSIRNRALGLVERARPAQRRPLLRQTPSFGYVVRFGVVAGREADPWVPAGDELDSPPPLDELRQRARHLVYDRDEIARLYRSGLTIGQVAERLECGHYTVWRALDELDVERRPRGGKLLESTTRAVELIDAGEGSAKQIAERLGIPASTLWSACGRAGVRLQLPRDWRADAIAEDVLVFGFDDATIADEYDVTTNTARRWREIVERRLREEAR